MTEVRVDFQKGGQRCPFCHDLVAVEGSDWVACSRCLARHHASCWKEGGCCASCQSPSPLEAQSPPGQIAGQIVGTPVPRSSEDEARRATARVFDEPRPTSAWLSAVLTPLTLGVFPVLDEAFSFVAHIDRHREEPAPTAGAPDLAERLVRAREQSLGSRSAHVLRGVLPAAGTLVAAIVYLLVVRHEIAAIFHNGVRWTIRPSDTEYYMSHYWLAQLIFMAVTMACLHIAREVTRRHEHHQFYARLVGDAVSPDTSRAVLDESRRGWTKRRIIDGLLTAGAVVPLFGFLTLPFVGARLRGALRLHEEHERLLPPTSHLEGKSS